MCTTVIKCTKKYYAYFSTNHTILYTHTNTTHSRKIVIVFVNESKFVLNVMKGRATNSTHLPGYCCCCTWSLAGIHLAGHCNSPIPSKWYFWQLTVDKFSLFKHQAKNIDKERKSKQNHFFWLFSSFVHIEFFIQLLTIFDYLIKF